MGRMVRLLNVELMGLSCVSVGMSRTRLNRVVRNYGVYDVMDRSDGRGRHDSVI